jgi:hypothetical protein
MYRIGWPFWKFLAKRGAKLKLRILVEYDDEAKVFIAQSHDLQGLVCEAPTFPELLKEVELCVGALLEEYLHSEYKLHVTDMRFLQPA